MTISSTLTTLCAACVLLFSSCKKTNSSNATATTTTGVTVSTLAGSGKQGDDNGTASMASFFDPVGLCVNNDGDVLVTDYGNGVIRKIAVSTGLVSNFAGNVLRNQYCDDGVGEGASFNNPEGIYANANGDIFVASDGCGMRTINSGGAVKTLWKNDIDNPITAYPAFACADNQGNVYTISMDNGADSHIYKIDNQGKISLFAGTGAYGYKDGAVLSAQFGYIEGICIDNNNDIFVADGSRIREITGGQVRTVAGGTSGYADGTGINAQFPGIAGICIDGKGNLYVSDGADGRIRKIDPQGVVITVAGDGNPGYKDGAAASAEFNTPHGLCVDAQGNLLVADFRNNRIRKISFK